jgi:hypothetical protein
VFHEWKNWVSFPFREYQPASQSEAWIESALDPGANLPLPPPATGSPTGATAAGQTEELLDTVAGKEGFYRTSAGALRTTHEAAKTTRKPTSPSSLTLRLPAAITNMIDMVTGGVDVDDDDDDDEDDDERCGLAHSQAYG